MEIQQLTPTPTAFDGSVPQFYDRDLGPLLFDFSGRDLAKRVARRLQGAGRVLEIACGTGILTEHLRRELPDSVEVVATDVNGDMLDFARSRRGHLEGVVFEQADAHSLSLADRSFDVVVCQFGVMFFSDKSRSFSEFARVLKPGGWLLWNVWGAVEENPVVWTARETISGFLSGEPARFFDVPFGFYDRATNTSLAEHAGLSEIEAVTVRETVRHSARSAALGLVQGTPGVSEIRERSEAGLGVVTDAVRKEIVREFGEESPLFELLEYVFCARKSRA